MLSDKELKSYQQDGQINSPVNLSSEMMQTIKEKMDLLFNNNPELDQDYAPDLFKYDKTWLDIAKAPEILDIVAQLIGDNIICWGSAFFAKKGIGGKATPWHQDGQYWPIEPLETCTVSPSPPISAGGGSRIKSVVTIPESVCFATVW